jgi:cytochrome c
MKSTFVGHALVALVLAASGAAFAEARVTAAEAEAMVKKGVTQIKANRARAIADISLDLRDADGKEHIRERVELARTKARFWQDYRTLNRDNKKMEPKSMYCERVDDLIVCGGIYRPA